MEIIVFATKDAKMNKFNQAHLLVSQLKGLYK